MKFISVTAPQHKNRHYVARLTAGGKSYTIIATCNSDDMAKRIADAMNNEKPFDQVLTEAKIVKARFAKK